PLVAAVVVVYDDVRVAVLGLPWGGSGIVDRLDPVKRSIFEVGRRTRRKTFPVTGGGGGGGGSGGRILWRGEREL
ncbi:hypothetical protein Tco_0447171, partial [Tanacetum coccineum]